MNIPFHKPHITNEEIDAVSKTLKSGWLTMGAKTLEFETAFRKYIGSNYAISLNSATSALHLALSALKIKKNDEVIIPANTFVSTAEAVTYLDAKPILCDIEYSTHNIDHNLIERLITPKTKAIIPVHFGGNPCKMDLIKNIAKKHNLKIIEDAAHAIPAKYQGEMIGTISDATCFSFYATKTLTTGEGGMVTTNCNNVAEKIILQRLHGIRGDSWNRYAKDNDWYYEIEELGYKYNITDIQSSIGLVQLEKLEWMKEERKKIASMYLNAFLDKLECIGNISDSESACHLFVIKVSNRNRLHKKLKEKGISTSVHFIPIHKHSYYKKRFSYNDKDFPVSNKVYDECLSLPIYPGLNKKQINYIINNVLLYAESIN